MDELLGGGDNLPWPTYYSYETKWFYQGCLLALLSKTGSIALRKRSDPYFWFKKLGVENIRSNFFAKSKDPSENILLDCLKRDSGFAKEYVLKYERNLKSGQQNKESTTKNKINFAADGVKAIKQAMIFVGFNDSADNVSKESRKLRDTKSFEEMKQMPLTMIQERLGQGNISPELDPYSYVESICKSSISNGEKFALLYVLVVAMSKKNYQIADEVSNKIAMLAKETGMPILTMMGNPDRPKLVHLMTKTLENKAI